MLDFGVVGGTMLVSSLYGMYHTNPKRKFKKILEASLATHLPKSCAPNRIKIEKIVTREYGYDAELQVPSGFSMDKFKDLLPVLQEDTISYIKFKYLRGRRCMLQFGRNDLDELIRYNPDLQEEGLSIPFCTPFGMKWVDFWDESTWHFLTAGATRMGKTVMLRLLISHLIHATQGKINMNIISAKLTDFHMFRKVPFINLAKTEGEFLELLVKLIKECKSREQLIEKHGAIDVKQLRSTHPDIAPDPIFLVIDEYARFSDSDAVQNRVMEIIETYGYVDVHVIISSQRPDASTVLKPRIRANILASLAFTTRDETNSKIIVGVPDAAHLGGVKGRGILLDGLTEVIQVPFISEAQAIELMKPHYRSVEDVDGARQNDIEIAETVPSFVTESDRETDLSGELEPYADHKPDHEATKPRRVRNRRAAAEG
jgi:hypothetical protein